MKIAVEAEVCTVVEKGEGTYHVLVKSAIWVLGFTTTDRPKERTVVRVEGDRPAEEAPKDVYDTVMAHPSVGIAPRMRGRYKYAELSDAMWMRSSKDVRDLWKERQLKRGPRG